MTAPAAIKGTYSDLKFIKSRKVAQVVIEVPIEDGSKVIAAFGTPNPAAETWVALARLNPAVEKPETPAEPAKERRPFRSLPLPQQIALRCNEGGFAKFVHERFPWLSVEDMAVFVRHYCEVDSRSEIQPGTPAAERWFELDGEYSLWLKDFGGAA